MPPGPTIILVLKVLVAAVTVLFAGSLAALATGRPRLHGRINTLFFVLTMVTVAGFEILLQFIDVKSTFDAPARDALRVHLWFSVPSAAILPLMLLSGRLGRRQLHIALGIVFLVLWAGTFVTGVFFLPHS